MRRAEPAGKCDVVHVVDDLLLRRRVLDAEPTSRRFHPWPLAGVAAKFTIGTVDVRPVCGQTNLRRLVLELCFLPNWCPMKLVVIANLKVGLSSLRVFQESEHCEISLVIAHPDLKGIGSLIQHFCAAHGIDYLESAAPNSEPVLERVRAAAPDYLFSIYNPNILKPEILSIPNVAVNFHAAPLPRYRGTNTFSWAIINGDDDYGVAWHIMEPTIDTGAIVSQRMFPLTGKETALALCQRSFEVGVELLREEIVPKLVSGLPRTVQSDSPSTYYGRKDPPPNNGRLDFRWEFDRIERLTRGLNYESAPNPFAYAIASVRDQDIHPLVLERHSALPEHRVPGRIEVIEDDAICVQCGDCVARITTALDSRRRRWPIGKLCERLGLGVGDSFS
jgi:methionyl-tRNA formyltransferase